LTPSGTSARIKAIEDRKAARSPPSHYCKLIRSLSKKGGNLKKMRSNRTFDPTLYDPLYREVMERCIAIQDAICKHDFSEIPSFDEWRELRSRFWNIYVYPKFEKVYLEMFPDEKGKKDDPDRFKGDFNILDYNGKMAIALCAWLKQEGFFHLFEGEVFFINLQPTDLAFILTDGVPYRRYPPEYVGMLLERVVEDATATRKKSEKLAAWLGDIALLAGLLLLVLIISIVWR